MGTVDVKVAQENLDKLAAGCLVVDALGPRVGHPTTHTAYTCTHTHIHTAGYLVVDALGPRVGRAVHSTHIHTPAHTHTHTCTNTCTETAQNAVHTQEPHSHSHMLLIQHTASHQGDRTRLARDGFQSGALMPALLCVHVCMCVCVCRLGSRPVARLGV